MPQAEAKAWPAIGPHGRSSTTPSQTIRQRKKYACRTGELAALGLKAAVYCSRCYAHRSIDPAADHLRDRCFATTRFRCTKIRYTRHVCECPGSIEIEPSVRLPVGGEYRLAFLACGTCLPPSALNFVPIDEPPWSVVKPSRSRFKCPGCRRPMSWHIHGPT